jgi:hypothetical protein
MLKRSIMSIIFFIGRYYPTASLGYTKAKTFADVSAGTVGTILQQATFPLLVWSSLTGND